MDFKEFSRLNLQRCEAASGFNHKLNSWSLSDWLTATMGELGEAANIAKKLNRVRDGIDGALCSRCGGRGVTNADVGFGESGQCDGCDGRGRTANKETATELRDKFRREIADVFIYLDLLAQSEGFLLADAVVETFDAKSQEIGYQESPDAG